MSADIESMLAEMHELPRAPTFFVEVSSTPRGHGILECIQCGRCAGGCPVARLTTFYNPRRLMEMITLGFRGDTLFRLSWHCLSCFTCLDRCPRGGDVGEIVLAIRSIAAKEGIIPKGALAMAKNVIETGHLINAAASVVRMREKLGLPTITQEAEVEKIAEATGLKGLIEGSRKV